MTRCALMLLVLLSVTACSRSFEATNSSEARVRVVSQWPEYGGGGGQRYVDLTQIDKSNVADLDIAWIYRHGDVSTGRQGSGTNSGTAFEATPILAEGQLIFCTPYNRVIALDPLTGGELWRFDPGVDKSGHYGNQLVCRGVSQWTDPDRAAADTCRLRIYTATNDGFLIALDGTNGKVCDDFGESGRVDLNKGVGQQEWLGEYQLTSPPAVLNGQVVVGGAVSDNVRIDAPSGVVRAFDARNGTQTWAFDLAPPGFDYENDLVSDEGFALGTPNVWGVMAVDEARDMLFIPTGNPAPDYFRTGEPDMDYYGTSVIALRGTTGEVLWHFNTVKNDFWDLDVGAQPTIVDLDINGVRVPALVQGTKMGFIFVLNRLTGEPVIDVEYRDVPRQGPLADQLSPTQPYPPAAFQVAPNVGKEDAWGLTFIDENECEDLFAGSRTGPLYTPITEEWTIVAPSNLGGINWGGVAVDPKRGLIAARSSNVPFKVKLIPRNKFSRREGREFGVELAEQRGVDYAMARAPLLSSWGIPCNKPPWGMVTAIDIGAESQKWQVPHGTLRDISPIPLSLEFGVPGVGAPIISASGLIFVGGAWENVLRAYDIETGEELWKGELPAGPQATPMSYSVTRDDGTEKQFVVIASGGHSTMGSTLGDYLVAFALP